MGFLDKVGDWFGGPKGPSAEKMNTADQAARDKAQLSNLTYNNIDSFADTGSTTFTRDAEGRPIAMNRTLNPALGFGTGMANQGLLMGNLPGTALDFSSAVGTPYDIAQRNIDAYGAMTSPMRQQQFDQMKVMMADRGLSPDSEISSNMLGNWMQQNNIADLNAAAQAWNAVPGMQAQMTNTAITQGNHPFQQAGLNLGLLGGINNLGVNNQFQGSQMTPVNASGNMQTAHQNDVARNNAMWSNITGLATGVGSMMSGGLFPTGGISNMFNSGQPAMSTNQFYNDFYSIPQGGVKYG